MGFRWMVRLLGGLAVEEGDRVITRFRTQKTGLLLAYLGLFPGRPHPREYLAEIFWPGCDPATGRHNISVALSAIRQEVHPGGGDGEPFLSVDRLNIQLNPQAVTVDVVEFQQALQQAAADPARAEAELSRAV